MQQFMVPQFIDVEDKIIGPITVRQFVLLLVAGLLCFLFYKLLAFLFFIIASILVFVLFAILAFAKINGRPIHFFLLNFIQTFKRPKLRVWNRETYVKNLNFKEDFVKVEKKKIYKKPPVSGSRLADLSLVINTGGVYQGEELVNKDNDVS